MGRGVPGTAVIGLLIGLLILHQRGLLPPQGEVSIAAIQLAVFALAGAALGWGLCRWLGLRLEAAQLEHFKRWIVRDESLVLVEIAVGKTARVMKLLREVEGDPPVTFAFHGASTFDSEPEAELFNNGPTS